MDDKASEREHLAILADEYYASTRWANLLIGLLAFAVVALVISTIIGFSRDAPGPPTPCPSTCEPTEGNP